MNNAEKQRQTIEWEKTGDVFKKIKDIKGIFHGRTGTIKDRNSWEQTEAKEIKKWQQEYTKELYKKRSQ